MTRVKKFVVAGAVAVILGFCQYEWFCIFGPPARWGTGVVDLEPKFGSATSPAAISFSDSVGIDLSPVSISDVERRASGVVGQVLVLDEIMPSGSGLLQTHGGRYWTEDQHLYFRRTASEDWREVHLPLGFIVQNPRLVNLNGHVLALVGRWNSWYPTRRNYKRFLRSIIRPELRAEYAIYSVEPESGAVHYLFPGHSVLLSPDRRFAAYMDSENGFSGFHTVRMWTIGSTLSKPVLSLSEIDPGSGTSFSYRWTKDSSALLISGDTQGFSKSSHGYGKFRTIYSIARDAVFNQQVELPTHKGRDQ